MKKKLQCKHPYLCRCIVFLIITFIVLELLSQTSMVLCRNINPLYNNDARGLLYEPENTIDVVTIGSSDVYSSVSPLEWWNDYGYTGYAWGEASQRIYETHEYLKKIYKKQTPKVVVIEVGMLYRDKTLVQNIDSWAKTMCAKVFPLVTYHRFFAPAHWKNLGSDPHSVTKGYLIRTEDKKVCGKIKYMKKSHKRSEMHQMGVDELKKCIDLCQSHGSEVVLLSVPSYSTWNMKKHNCVSDLAKTYGVPYVDLNTALKKDINWKSDTADGGSHLNTSGSSKVTSYLGAYLAEHYDLPDHRTDNTYASWDSNYEAYTKELTRIHAR